VVLLRVWKLLTRTLPATWRTRFLGRDRSEQLFSDTRRWCSEHLVKLDNFRKLQANTLILPGESPVCGQRSFDEIRLAAA
jgi:hypothetical protein